MYIFYYLAFIEEPGPGPFLQPLGTQVRLNCRVSQGYRLQWTFQLLGQTSVITLEDTDVEAEQGITIKTMGRNSVLTIRPPKELKSAQIRCLALHLEVLPAIFRSKIVNVTIYGMCNIIHVVNIECFIYIARFCSLGATLITL